MTLFLFVRHAAHDLVDTTLCGRMPGVALNEAGRREAAAVGSRLAAFGVTCVQSSPRERALETASAVAGSAGLSVEICPALDEVDFGLWTGRGFDELASDPLWRLWNASRARARPPGGESMAEAQARVVAHLRAMQAMRPRDRVVLVTHAEIVRAAVLYTKGLPLDDWPRIAAPPGSILAVRRLSDCLLSSGPSGRRLPTGKKTLRRHLRAAKSRGEPGEGENPSDPSRVGNPRLKTRPVSSDATYRHDRLAVA